MQEVRFCKECGRQLKYSKAKTGLCNDCRVKHLKENIQQLKRREGDYYNRWIFGMAKFWFREYDRLKRQAKEAETDGN